MVKVFQFFDDVSREEEDDIRINVTEEKATDDITQEILGLLTEKHVWFSGNRKQQLIPNDNPLK